MKTFYCAELDVFVKVDTFIETTTSVQVAKRDSTKFYEATLIHDDEAEGEDESPT